MGHYQENSPRWAQVPGENADNCAGAGYRRPDRARNHMSAISSLSSSSSVNYAVQLAQTSALQRSLYNLGAAVQRGDLSSAGSILTAFIRANPQYATGNSDSSGTTTDPINQDFQTLADAISNQQPDAAQNAWSQIQKDLSADGVPALTSSSAATAKLLAENNASLSQKIVSDAFGTSAGTGISVTSLLGGGASGGSAAGLSSSLLSNWLTYEAGGMSSPILTATSSGSVLNTTA